MAKCFGNYFLGNSRFSYMKECFRSQFAFFLGWGECKGGHLKGGICIDKSNLSSDSGFVNLSLDKSTRFPGAPGGTAQKVYVKKAFFAR